MPTFVATSDWHIGARQNSAGPAAPRFRAQRYATARRIVALAAEVGASALFLLGDTFEGDRVGQDDLEETGGLLGEAPCPVFVLPGNHDWWHPGGVLRGFAAHAASIPNIRMLTEPEEPLRVEGLDGVTFYPGPVLKHVDVADPTRWIPARDAADGLRIGLFHGALDRADIASGTIPERVAEVRDLDLALLGDWHKPVAGTDGRTFYCGSPEPGGFDEEHVGQVIVVDVADGEATHRAVEVGTLAWRTIPLEFDSTVAGGAGLAPLEEALAAIETKRANTALRLKLGGRLALSEQEALDERLTALAEEEWAHVVVASDVAVEGALDLDAFDEPSMRAVAERVWRAEGDPDVRRRALALLRQHVEASR